MLLSSRAVVRVLKLQMLEGFFEFLLIDHERPLRGVKQARSYAREWQGLEMEGNRIAWSADMGMQQHENRCLGNGVSQSKVLDKIQPGVEFLALPQNHPRSRVLCAACSADSAFAPFRPSSRAMASSCRR